VEAIRDTGAKNIIVAGGIRYSQNINGIAGEAGDGIDYSLVDQGSNGDKSKAGNGIVYDIHVSNNRTRAALDRACGTVRKMYPVIAGDVGYCETSSTGIQPLVEYDWYEDYLIPWLEDTETYGSRMSVVISEFYPSGGDSALLKSTDDNGNKWSSDEYVYTPTVKNGVPVKRLLEQRQEGDLIKNMSAYYASEEGAELAVDGNDTTSWDCYGRTAYVAFDLGKDYMINRYILKQGGYKSDTANLKDFRLQVSEDGEEWTDIDVTTGSDFNVTDRWVANARGRFVRLWVDATNGDAPVKLYDFKLYGTLPPPALDVSVAKNDSGEVNLDLAITDAENVSGMIIVAVYSADNTIKECRFYDAAEHIEDSIPADDGSYIKAMWWNGPDLQAPNLSAYRVELE
jgi:hypothetical protein